MANIQVFQLIERKELYDKILPNVETLMTIDQKVCFSIDWTEIFARNVRVTFPVQCVVFLDYFGHADQAYG